MKYSLDANILIKPWNDYYPYDLCPSYWNILSELGRSGIVFITEQVKSEIDNKDDNLKRWLNDNRHLILPIDDSVQLHLNKIYAADETHKNLLQNDGNHSVADPWVIAHAWALNGTVVSNETYSVSPHKRKIKIPDVCKNLNIKHINEHSFAREIGLAFSCIKYDSCPFPPLAIIEQMNIWKE